MLSMGLRLMPRTIEDVRRAKREHMARKRASDPEASRQYQRDWHAANRERNTQKMRDYYARRFFWGRAMKLRGADRADYRQLASLWRRQRGLCALTGRRLDRSAEVDHILPKVRGGGDAIGNLRWVTRQVNLAKRDLTDDEFVEMCCNVMRWIGRRIEMADSI